MNTRTSFAVGDTVQLKSGGPIMTVDQIMSRDGSVNCKWFDSKDQVQLGHFPMASLTFYDHDAE